jgi:phosphate transport system substrate-binding protein
MHQVQDKPEAGKSVLAFFDWAYKNGDKAALELDYIPIPDVVAKLVEAEWKNHIKDAAGKPVF